MEVIIRPNGLATKLRICMVSVPASRYVAGLTETWRNWLIALLILEIIITELLIRDNYDLNNKFESIDWLIKFTNTGSSPITQWEQRYDNPYLQKLSQSVAKYPKVFLPIARRILTFANWVSDERRETITDFDATPRLGSFQGGFPWTCDSFPWPRNEDGSPMSPVLQLNLAELPLCPLGKFPPILYQVWGAISPDGLRAKEVSRAIPLHVIAKCKPSSALFQPNNTVLGFDREGSVGDMITPDGAWRFSLGQSYFASMSDVFDIRDLPDDYIQDANDIEEQVAALDVLIDEDYFLFLDGGFFGGQLKSYYDGSEGFEIAARSIYSPRNAMSDFSVQTDGLRTFNGGFLGIMRKIEDGSIFTQLAW